MSYSDRFLQSLRDAGLGQIPISWLSDGTIRFDDSASQETRDAVLAVAAVDTPDPKASVKAEIVRLLKLAGIEQVWQLDAGLAAILSLGLSQGLTESDIYAINPGYRQIKDLRALVAIQESLL